MLFNTNNQGLLFFDLPFQKGKEIPIASFGEQIEIVFGWFARIYIDMKKALKMGFTFSFAMQRVKAFKEVYKNSGDVSKCPDYVYFLDEV